MAVFHRPALAARLVENILEGGATSSGLFLAAPRRTGKSTFLREDLMPALSRVGAKALYVDLWADKKADPSDVIVGAVRSELAAHDGVIKKLARAAGMEKAAVGGLTFSLDKIGLGSQVSLSQALAALSDEVRAPIVIIIDEAQHAITTTGGYDALFALKAARDELNSSAHHQLRIVATGSNRDKLAMLRNSKDHAFFLAPLVAFPALDEAYVQWFCDTVKLGAPLDPARVRELFLMAGNRPEILGAAADSVRYNLLAAPERASDLFEAAVREQIVQAQDLTLRVLHSLTPLQSTVLRVLAANPQRFSPYEAETMQSYRLTLARIAPDNEIKPDTSNVQQALAALQEKALIWKENRGVYALEDDTMAELMRGHGMLDAVETPSEPADALPALRASERQRQAT